MQEIPLYQNRKFRKTVCLLPSLSNPLLCILFLCYFTVLSFLSSFTAVTSLLMDHSKNTQMGIIFDSPLQWKRLQKIRENLHSFFTSLSCFMKDSAASCIKSALCQWCIIWQLAREIRAAILRCLITFWNYITVWWLCSESTALQSWKPCMCSGRWAARHLSSTGKPRWEDGEEPCREGLGNNDGWESGHDPALCKCVLSSQKLSRS